MLGTAGVWRLFPHEKEMVMALVARIIGYSMLTSVLGALLGLVLFVHHDGYPLPTFLLACVGAMVGAVAGAAGEVVTAQRFHTRPEVLKPMSKTFEVED
jgi:hypothetical protein